VELISFKTAYPTRAGRSIGKPTEELQSALAGKLRSWRSDIISRDYPNQRMVTGRQILVEDVIAKIVARPGAVVKHGVDTFNAIIPWRFGVSKYGQEVVDIVVKLSELFPNPEQERRDTAARELEERRMAKMAGKDYRRTLKLVFEECYQAIEDITTGEMVMRGRGKDRREVLEKKCQPFMRLPSRAASLSLLLSLYIIN
jgi:hypothetical protein